MDALPTDAVVTVDRARISSGDAVAHRPNPAELFNIEMDELAWSLAFITPDWFSRLQGTELVQPQPTRNPATVAGDARSRRRSACPSSVAGAAARPPPATAWDVGCRSRCGRDERSSKPAKPSRRYRSTRLRTVRGQTPTASATASGICPLATCRTIRSRPRGVSRAFLCTFIRFSLGI